MCPERGVLSAYLDGELAAPWKASVDEHLGRCPACAGALAALRSVRERLLSEEDPDLVDAMVRVRNSLDAATPSPASRWRFVAIPLPLAVVAATLVLALGGALAFAVVRPWEPSSVRFTSSPTGVRQFEISGNAEDIQKILAVLNRDAVDRSVTFDIPKGYRFAPFGEPELLPALQGAAR